MQHGEEFDGVLGDIRDLIDEAVSKYREWSNRSPIDTPVGPGCTGMREAARHLVSQARHSVDVVVAAGGDKAVEVCTALSHLLRGERAEVTARVLCTHATVEQESFRDFLKADHPFRVRVAPMPYLETLVVDGEVALVRAERTADAAVIRTPAVLEPFQALFASAWRGAAPPGGGIGPASPLRSDFTAGVLRQLHTGNTDDTAARELGVSVRTYRRYVAEIMEALGTKSRFQAGVRAAEHGLIRPPVPPARGGERCGLTAPPLRPGGQLVANSVLRGANARPFTGRYDTLLTVRG